MMKNFNDQIQVYLNNVKYKQQKQQKKKNLLCNVFNGEYSTF